MALNATVFKIELAISDIDRGHYATYPLTVARHPSETDVRMMLRVLAFALFANERLEFGRGLSDVDEPHLRITDLTGETELWIELGTPDPKRLHKALARSRRLVVMAYGRAVPLWWRGVVAEFGRVGEVEVFAVADQELTSLASLVQRTMQLQCTIQDGLVWVSDATRTVAVTPQRLEKDTYRASQP
ncbi:MAG: YaeQ family protein [Burkholderiaceae bacterium]|jgi:uncharacterized protein YaeQ